MKNVHWLTWASLVLWLATVSYGSYYFVYGSTTKNTADKRIAVVLTPGEREFVLDEMRGLVVGLKAVMAGLAKDDMKMVSKALSSMGMALAADDSPVLLGKLPLGLKSMGLGLHKKMDVLAAQLTQKKMTKIQLFGELRNALGTCVACHSTYKIVSDSGEETKYKRTVKKKK